MASYTYVGRSAGKQTKGTIEAMTANLAAEALLGRGITPLKIEEVREVGASSNNIVLFKPKIKPTDIMMFSRQINLLLRSGVPILRALAGLTESATNPKMRETLFGLRKSLESGRDLSSAMAEHPSVFSGFYVSMVRVGEMTGQLDGVFLRLFHHMEFDVFTRQQVKSALRYPTFVILAMVIAIGIVNVMVIPAFEKVFAQAKMELPIMTRVLLASSKFTVNYWWVILLVVVGLIGGFKYWVKTPKGRRTWDELSLKLPIVGPILRKSLLARFAKSFAMSIKSGVPIVQALSIVSVTVSNEYMSEKLEIIRDRVERGETILRGAIVANIFTPIILQMIAVGEEVGAIDEMMDEIGSVYGNEVENDLKGLSAQIEPILILFMGGIVLVLALGVFVPMWDMGKVSTK